MDGGLQNLNKFELSLLLGFVDVFEKLGSLDLEDKILICQRMIGFGFGQLTYIEGHTVAGLTHLVEKKMYGFIFSLKFGRVKFLYELFLKYGRVKFRQELFPKIWQSLIWVRTFPLATVIPGPWHIGNVNSAGRRYDIVFKRCQK